MEEEKNYKILAIEHSQDGKKHIVCKNVQDDETITIPYPTDEYAAAVDNMMENKKNEPLMVCFLNLKKINDNEYKIVGISAVA